MKGTEKVSDNRNKHEKILRDSPNESLSAEVKLSFTANKNIFRDDESFARRELIAAVAVLTASTYDLFIFKQYF